MLRFILETAQLLKRVIAKGSVAMRSSSFSAALTGGIIVLLLYAASIAVRVPDFNQPGSENLEASYHVLLTVTAFQQGKPSDHWFLPTVTLSDTENRGAPWGSTIRTRSGHNVYTSFLSLGFIVPYLAFQATSLEVNTRNLSYINTAIGALSAAALYILLLKIVSHTKAASGVAVPGAVVGTVAMIFSREALQSTGVSYWHQSLYQPVLIVSIYVAIHLVATKSEPAKLASYGTVLLSFLGPLVEWTGYVFNAGLIVAIYLSHLKARRALVLLIATASALAAVLTVLHFGAAVGIESVLLALKSRFLARTSLNGQTTSLLQGYALSYGVFLVLPFFVMAGFAYGLLRDSYCGKADGVITARVARAALVLSFFPLLENILLLQHATQFSFDRLKFTVPFSILLALTYVALDAKWRTGMLALIAAASFQGVISYKLDLHNYGSWAKVDQSNRDAVRVIKSDDPCSLFATSLLVRGYYSLLLGREIWEEKSLSETISLVKKFNACNGVHIEGRHWNHDLPEILKITRVGSDGEVEVLWKKK